MRVVAFDSRMIRRENPNFKALLGVGVTIPNYAKFVSEYDKVFDDIFSENRITRTKRIYKGSDLTEIFFGLGIDIVPICAEKLIKIAGYIDIYYLYYPPNSIKDKNLKVGIYYDEEIKRISSAEFIDLIQGSFPTICCYSHLKRLTSKVDATSYFIDDCPGLKPCIAISSVIKQSNTHFVFKGDQANYAISCADIICKYIDDICFKKGLLLNNSLIDNLGLKRESTSTTYIGTQWLNEIKPSRNVTLNISHKYPHPVYYFFVDKQVFEQNSKEVIEKSKLFRFALNKASESMGAVKFFEPKDQEMIKKEDFLVINNDRTKEKIAELIRLGCEAKPIEISYFYEKNITS